MFGKTFGMLAAVAAVIAATPAAADNERWLYIGADEKAAGFVDLDSITSGETPELRLIVIPSGFREGDHEAMYFAMVHVRVNCPARTTQLLSAKGYSDVGELVMSKGLDTVQAVDPAELTSVNTLRIACGLPGVPHDIMLDSSAAAIRWWRMQ